MINHGFKEGQVRYNDKKRLFKILKVEGKYVDYCFLDSPHTIIKGWRALKCDSDRFYLAMDYMFYQAIKELK